MINNPIYKNDNAYHKMIEQIDKYWDKLFADPILVKTPTGEIWVQPQRTNNVLEQFFRNFKRDHRRTSGNNSITKKLQAMFDSTSAGQHASAAYALGEIAVTTRKEQRLINYPLLVASLRQHPKYARLKQLLSSF